MTLQPRVLVLGDSHAIGLVQALRQTRPDVQAFGGQLTFGGRATGSFYFCDEQGRLRFLSPVQEQFEGHARAAGYDRQDLLDIDLPIILSLSGVQWVARQPIWDQYLPAEATGCHFMSRQMFETILADFLREIFAFYACLAAANKPVTATIAPGLRSNDGHRAEIFLKVRDYVVQELTKIGIPVVDLTGQTCDPSGVLEEEYWREDSQDITHANLAWASLMVDACLKQLGVQTLA